MAKSVWKGKKRRRILNTAGGSSEDLAAVQSPGLPGLMPAPVPIEVETTDSNSQAFVLVCSMYIVS